eukprot:jgi/Phyca11/8394/fgenesh1_pm.PHYCAscaffold_27_\
MALLMPDINLRRAKRHLERYWHKLLGGDRPGERRRLIFRSNSVGVAPPIQNLESDPEMEANIEEVARGNDKRGVELDFDEPECNEPAITGEFSKLESQQAPTSTSTTGTWPTLGAMLQRIHLNDGDVSELDFSALAQHNKRLGAEGCALVARSLTTNHTVRKLFIRDHAIGDDGAIALSKMLCNNATLEYLDLYGNNIGDRGAEALAQALYGHDSLKHLRAIRCNCTIKSLELVHNRITKVGAQALLEALDVNIHLETLDLKANPVPEFVTSQLAAALARNRAESLILESQAAEKKAVKIVRRASGLETEDEDDSSSDKEDDDEGWEEDEWEDDDGDSVSSGFLSCSGVTDIPLSSSGLWI